MTRKLTGFHVLAIFVSAFTVIIGVNLTLAWNAVQSFPGLVVQNSYVASQGFNARLAAQQGLGWETALGYEDGVLRLTILDAQGQPAELASLTAVMGRATHQRDDFTPGFERRADGYEAAVDLAPGYWHLRLVARDAAGTEFQQTLRLGAPQGRP